jgi:hypothetical protein
MSLKTRLEKCEESARLLAVRSGVRLRFSFVTIEGVSLSPGEADEAAREVAGSEA